MNYEEQIKEWISLDNQIKSINKNLIELKEKRNKLEKSILEISNNNNISNKIINIGSNKIKLTTSKIAEPLTFKYLEKSLNQIIKNNDQANSILNFIKENRNIKIINEIKRL